MAFCDRLPLTKTPVSLAIICVVVSLLVQVTVVPALTVRVPGTKVKLEILTVLPEVDVPVVEVVVFAVEQLATLISNAVVKARMAIGLMYFLIYSPF